MANNLSLTTNIKVFAKKSPDLILFILAMVITGVEFFFDLNREPLLNNLVFFLNIILIVIYFFGLFWRSYRYKKLYQDYFSHHKADLVYALLIVFFLYTPRIAAGLIIFRLGIGLALWFLETSMGVYLLANLNLRPSQTLALSFIGLIGLGSILLLFPAATTDGQGASFIDALFLITSASCVAGLSIHDLGSDFTYFGQGVILFCIQIGGLGIMALSAAFAVLVGGSIPSKKQVGLSEVLDISTPEGLRALIKSVVFATIITEFIGALMFFLLLTNNIDKPSERLWWSIFHAISAFANCGLSLSKDNLVMFVGNPFISFIFMMLITIGGAGFFVISDLTNPDVWVVKRPKAIWHRLAIQTKVVLIATLLLDFSGMLLFLFFEYDGVLHGLTIGQKINASLFHAISLRSAGFNLVPLANIAGPTIMFSIVFMFIGASPGSTGGGIKTTTAAVSVMALRAMLRGRDEVELFGRSMPSSIISRSLSMVLVALLVVVIFLTLLLASQDIKFEHLFFEVVSAFGTVGFSLDTTMKLNNMGKILIILVMYVGRIGPLTLALAIGERKVSQGYILPKGRIAIG